MRKKTVEFICDYCGDSVTGEYECASPLIEVKMPAMIWDGDRGFNKGMTKVELCEKCYEEYWEYVRSKFKFCEDLGGVHNENRT